MLATSQDKNHRHQPANFSKVDENVFRSAKPQSIEEVEYLKSNGIKTIISLDELPSNLQAFATDSGVVILNHLLADFTYPSTDFVDSFLDTIGELVASNRKVLVHCTAGKQRTALMVGFYLIRFEGMTPLEAYWNVDRNSLGDDQGYKHFLLNHGAKLYEQHHGHI